MKRLFVPILMLALASTASANLQISVNGNPDPVDSEITLLPGDTIELDIWTDAEIPVFGANNFMIVVATTEGTITGGAGIAGMWTTVVGPTQDNGLVIPPPGMEGIWGFYANFGAPIPSGSVLADGLIFRGETIGEGLIGLYELIEGAPAGQLWDQVIIHIPEPGTMALLGLGGLFLLRRRK